MHPDGLAPRAPDPDPAHPPAVIPDQSAVEGATRAFFPSPATRRRAWLAAHVHLVAVAPILLATSLGLVWSLLKGQWVIAVICAVVGLVPLGFSLLFRAFMNRMEAALEEPASSSPSTIGIIEIEDPSGLRRAAVVLFLQVIPLVVLVGDTLPGACLVIALALASALSACWARRERLRLDDTGVQLTSPLQSIHLPWDDLVVAECLTHIVDRSGRLRTSLLLMSKSRRMRSIVIEPTKASQRLRSLLDRKVPADSSLAVTCTVTGALPPGAVETR